jgi:hypothetical protein
MGKDFAWIHDSSTDAYAIFLSNHRISGFLEME